MAKKIPQRMCVACRRMLPKMELLRLVQTDTGLLADAGGKMQGRGLYLCGEVECQKQFLQPRSLSKLLHRKVEAEEAAVLADELQAARLDQAEKAQKRTSRRKTAEKRPVRIVKVKAANVQETQTK